MPVDISIIVPVFDEEDNVLPLVREIAVALDKEPRAFELFFVDDASRDKVRAEFKDGVLTVRLAKDEKAKRQQVEINVS